MEKNPPMALKPGTKPLSPPEVKEGDIVVCAYHPSVTGMGPRKVARKYLVLKVHKEPRAGPIVTCVVLYAYRFKTPGEVAILNLPTLPTDSWFMEA